MGWGVHSHFGSLMQMLVDILDVQLIGAFVNINDYLFCTNKHCATNFYYI